jgi:ubiquitin C-terminal hydrolase
MKVNGSRGYGRYQQQPPVYRLFAVSNHMGGLNSGHYTAYARHRGQRKWYYFDDRNVTEVTFRIAV